MAHRNTVRHYHDVGHPHELTFSCYRRLPWLTNDVWREKLARCIEAADEECSIELVGFLFMPEYVHLLVYDYAGNRVWHENTVSKAQGTPVYCDEFYKGASPSSGADNRARGSDVVGLLYRSPRGT